MSLAIVSASYAPDFAGFARLHESVLQNTTDEVPHIVVVPDAHASLFRSIRSPRLDVRPYATMLPARFVQTTWLGGLRQLPRGFRIAAVNAAQPWPPIRGWIMQQVIKLGLVASLRCEVALLIDSDVLVVRPLHESSFLTADGTVRLYRRPFGVTPDMTRHVSQQARALRLLGLDRVESDSPDYISAFASWDPELVRDCLARIEATTGRPWWDAVAGSLDFSEFLTYGAYAMTIADPTNRQFVAERSLCHSHWGGAALTRDAAQRFVEALQPDDVAIHVQSNTSTDESVLRFIAEAAARI